MKYSIACCDDDREVLEQLKDLPYRIIVRPHPQYVRHFSEKLDALSARYEKDGIEIQRDFSSNKTVYTADLLVIGKYFRVHGQTSFS